MTQSIGLSTSSRTVTYSKDGMVATSQPLAAEAGAKMLRRGGNAIDAAIAMAAALTVVEPTSNGLGGDAFAIVETNQSIKGFNGSGRAPASISIDALKARGMNTMPKLGIIPVTVPGAVKLWADLHKQYGALPFEDVLAPAILLAENGYPVSPVVSHSWQRAQRSYKNAQAHFPYDQWARVFTQNGKTPKPGDVITLKGHAKALKAIAKTKGNDFYEGDIAKAIIKTVENLNGFLSLEDLKNHTTTESPLMNMRYHGGEIIELAPNTQGVIALEALGIMHYKNALSREANLHASIEAMKHAFSDGLHHITDLNDMSFNPEAFLTPSFLKARANALKDTAQIPKAVSPKKGGTVYLATADQYGSSVSFIQSNYMGFGSGVVVDAYGIALQNRGHTFSLNPDHANALKGNKRSYHTIIPGYIKLPDGRQGPFGVMGGFMQPQGHMQVAMHLIDDNMTVQEALDAPRWQWLKANELAVESCFDASLINALKKRGHVITLFEDPTTFGRGQIILRNPLTHVLEGGCERRADSHIALP